MGTLLGGVVLLGAGADAQAAGVAVTSVFGEGYHCNLCGDLLGVDVQVTATAGEVNHFTAARVGDRLVLSDATAPLAPAALPADSNPLAAGTPCTVIDEHSVSCPTALTLRATLGDGDDTATIGDGVGPVVLAGGDGDDVLTGGRGDDRLDGGGGRDELHGGDGDDVLLGAEPAPAPDRLDGGPGSDTVQDDGSGGVRIDLRTQRATGSAIGTDTLTAVENASGGAGADVLVGDAGPNRLIGADGSDLLRGAAGDDVLYAGSPSEETGRVADWLDGGPGNDLLDLSYGWVDDEDLYATVNASPDQRADRVRCGAGEDRVSYADDRDALPLDCDRAGWADSTGPGQPTIDLSTLRAGRRTVTVQTIAAFGQARLRSTGSQRPHAPLSTPAPRITDARRGTLRFRLNPAGRRLAAQRRPVTVAIVGLRDDQGTPGSLAIALPRL
jgi:Ca2+-binding RTX toxin-like protein